MTILFFLIIPILVIFSAQSMYRHNGKRRLLQFDLVQFIYAFVIAPTMFLWAKSFLFVILQKELNNTLSLTELFIVDSIFSVIFLFIFAFVVIHSLTKTFNLNQETDPLYDVFQHSEFFHQEFSHLGIYVGGMLMLSLISIANVFFPFLVEPNRALMYSGLLLSVMGAVISFSSMLLFETDSVIFFRIIKLLMGLVFLLHAAFYFLLDPDFNIAYSVYWFVFLFFFTMVGLGLFTEKTEDKKGLFSRLPFQINVLKIKYYWRFAWKTLGFDRS